MFDDVVPQLSTPVDRDVTSASSDIGEAASQAHMGSLGYHLGIFADDDDE